jgi:hypothetical protein
VQEFSSFLFALNSTELRVKHLSHDQLPVKFFVLPENTLRYLTKPLSHLTTLSLNFSATAAPHPKFWSGLTLFLRSIPNVVSLRFGFAPDPKGCKMGTWRCTVPGKDFCSWYVPLWKIFGDHTWRELVKLRLDGLFVCETGLGEFLGRHSMPLYNQTCHCNQHDP